MTIIGDNIRNRRIQLGITQEELAEKLGYKSKSSINKIELGVNDIPQSKILKFADALYTTPKVLMGWESVEKENDAIADIVVKLREDDDFRELVHAISKLDKTQIAGVKQLLNAFM